MTDSSQVDGLVDRAMTEHGKLDIMFSNAGGARPEVTDEISDEDYRRVLALNLDGVFYGTRAALRVMVPRKSGCILITTSGAGLGAVPGLAQRPHRFRSVKIPFALKSPADGFNCLGNGLGQGAGHPEAKHH